jgi:hypothetical protein
MRDDDDEFKPDLEAPRHRVPPRNSRAGHWVVAWVEGVDAPNLEHGLKECRDCREKFAILHAVGNEIRRVVCGKCQGDFNRGRL